MREKLQWRACLALFGLTIETRMRGRQGEKQRHRWDDVVN